METIVRFFQQPRQSFFLLHRGSERLEEEGILCLPCAEFLRRLHPRSKEIANLARS